MTNTHQSREGLCQVRAWQFQLDARIPGWVALNLHDVDGSRRQLSAIAKNGQLVTVKLDDWIICEFSTRTLVVLNDDEFHKCFEPI